MFQRWPLCVLTVAASFAGCAEAPATKANQTPAVVPADGSKKTAAAVLSAEDQSLADQQKVCPVGGEALGSMGTPVKMMVGDRAVFLCCEGCRGAVEKDPEKYLAQLDAPQSGTAGEAVPAAEVPAPAKIE